MANCFKRLYGATWCTEYIRSITDRARESRVADFCKKGESRLFLSQEGGEKERRMKELPGLCHCFIMRLMFEIFYLLTPQTENTLDVRKLRVASKSLQYRLSGIR